MPGIRVTVADKIATPQDDYVVADNTDYTVDFTLDAEWANAGPYTMRVITPEGSEDVSCTGTVAALPRLYCDGIAEIGIFAGDALASTPARIRVERSVITGNAPETGG